MSKENIDQKLIEVEATEVVEKKRKRRNRFLKNVCIFAAGALVFGVGTYAYNQYKTKKTAASAATNEEVDVEQPQVSEETTVENTPRENKTDRYGNNHKRNGRWDNN